MPMRTVAGIFGTLVQTRKVIEQLSAAGFAAESVSVISPRTNERGIEREEGAEGPGDTVDKRDQGTTHDERLDVAEELPVTSPNLAQISPLGPTLVPLVEADANPMTGRTGVGANGLHKSLVEWGFTDAQVRDYESQIAEGRALLAIEVVEEAQAGRAADILRQEGADRITVANPFSRGG